MRNLPGSFYDTWNTAVVICDTAILENYRNDDFNLTNINPWLSSFLVTNPENIGQTRHRTKTNKKLSRWITPTPPKTTGEPQCTWRVSTSCLLLWGWGSWIGLCDRNSVQKYKVSVEMKHKTQCYRMSSVAMTRWTI